MHSEILLEYGLQTFNEIAVFSANAINEFLRSKETFNKVEKQDEIINKLCFVHESEEMRILINLYSMTVEQISNLWGYLSATYQTSAYYKVKVPIKQL